MTISSLTPPAATLPEAPRTESRKAWGILAILTLVYSFSWMDRFLLIISLDPISRDLHVSNTEIGLLTGFGASLLYSLAGFPIARLADRNSRIGVISTALAAWSTLTAAIGLVASFVTLAACRFGIAIASAGCSPAVYSLIADIFPARRRGTAIAIYSLGISIGTWAGLTLGGYAADSLGWRRAFVVLGLPGFCLAAILFFLVREPSRGTLEDVAGEDQRNYSLGEAVRYVMGQPAFAAIVIGFGLVSLATSAFENWVPTYLIRAYGLSATEVGSVSGLAQGFTAIVGALIFGILSDRLARRNSSWYIWVPLICTVAATPLIVLFFIVSKSAAYVCYFLIEFCISGYSAPLFAASQMLLPPRLRAVGMATVLFMLNVLGTGLGTFLTGWASDLIGGAGPAGGLSVAIIAMQVLGLLGMAALAYAARVFRPS
ncbi:MFS transporter [Sphingomonas sp. PL-96]|uniref:spinster family MFS transporter n=1 Tax=Sphingomonas sp. PL-96 TaxID=2887201 RepID=UPI001E51A5EB|nr:MFS transporter [Sphingomonas sp. PL-96]MCC2978315.1 MFS transporter [Sphingomonas sp. PL-96]